MAYMSQERKAQIQPVVKKLLKEYKLSGSMSVHNHSTLVLNIKSGAIDFLENINRVMANKPGPDRCRVHVGYVDVNPYWYKEHFDGKALECLTKIMDAMNVGNHDRSDSMTDFFDVGWYTDVNIGSWGKPYVLFP
jgi:hypothetical protein